MPANSELSGETRYRCVVCGYVYVPSLGDLEADIEPGTLFDDIPDTWTCPICGVAKSMFRKEG